MTNSQEHPTPRAVADAYDALLEQTRIMLRDAKQQQWASLIERGADYIVQSERLAHLNSNITIPDDMRLHNQKQLEKILANNLEIRNQLISRRDELGEMIGSAQRQKSLSRAYGSQGEVHQLNPARVSGS